MSDQSNLSDKPLIGPEQSLREITFRAVIISIILTIVLCASNAYLGLKVGVTISASIPAAIIAMGVLRFFKNSNVLESNIIQTAASVGEALVAGVAFVTPALLVLHYWTYFHFWGTLILSMLGGTLGMLFSIPVRRVMLADKSLRFPEGTAIGSVLKASNNGDAELKPLVQGGVVGGLIGLFQAGFGIIADHLNFYTQSGKWLIGFGWGFSPALIAAGYIVGISVSVSMLAGVIIGWVIGIPILASHFGMPDPSSASNSAAMLWQQHLRFVGVGSLLIGGLWTMVILIKPIFQGIQASIQSVREMQAAKRSGTTTVPRTERDIPINLALFLVLIVAVFLFVVLFFEINPAQLGMSPIAHLMLCLIAVIFVLLGGFLFASIAAYFAGLVGSTNNPGSGLTVSCILLLSGILIVTFGLFSHLSHARALMFSSFIIMVAVVLCCIMSIACDTMQDLKAGQMVGATPWKQQVMLILGVIVASMVIAPILQLLFHAYGIAGVFPRPGMQVSQMLAAPQATMMAAVVQGVFGHDLPWPLLGIGAALAVIGIFFDEYLKTQGMRFSVLAMALGVYLPLDSSTPMILGGVLSYLIHVRLKKNEKSKLALPTHEARTRQHRGILLACGLVAGASIMGVLLAIPFALKQSADALKIVPDSFTPIANGLGVIVSLLLCYWIYHTVMKKKRA